VEAGATEVGVIVRRGGEHRGFIGESVISWSSDIDQESTSSGSPDREKLKGKYLGRHDDALQEVTKAAQLRWSYRLVS
jgi:hypothetical protein